MMMHLRTMKGGHGLASSEVCSSSSDDTSSDDDWLPQQAAQQSARAAMGPSSSPEVSQRRKFTVKTQSAELVLACASWEEVQGRERFDTERLSAGDKLGRLLMRDGDLPAAKPLLVDALAGAPQKLGYSCSARRTW
jgi:hypothetical protein